MRFIHDIAAAVLLLSLLGCSTEADDDTTSDDTPPVVARFIPEHGQTVTDSVAIYVSADDDVGVLSIQVMLDGAFLGLAGVAAH
jgi:hypothetical protein